MSERWDVTVVGGGVAGIAAALRLSRTGLRVLMLDKRPYLGGRASSFVDHTTGQLTDVCQHVTLGCCMAFERLLCELGVADRLKYLHAIPFQDRQGRRAELKAARLPAPYHLAPSLLALPWLSLRDRLSAMRMMQAVSGHDDSAAEDLDFLTYLRARGIGPELVRLVVDPLIVSACNAHCGDVAVGYGIAVLREALLQSRTGYRPGLFTVPLAELFTDPACAALARSGGHVRQRTAVRNVTYDCRKGYTTHLRSGETIQSAACVLAVSCDVAPTLMPADAADSRFRSNIASLRHAPIAAVHLWFDEELDCPEALGLLDRDVHWVFNKSRTWHSRPAARTYITTVTSAAYELGAMDRTEILRRTLADVAAAARVAALPRPTHVRVTIERKATFVAAPGTDRFRPAQATRLPALAVAGEWTATGWPSTMEGAVRSGRAAADLILRDLS